MLFGTLKSLSSGLPETVQAVWIENGHARHPGGGESGMRQLRMSLSNELIVDLFAGGHPIDVLTCDLAEAINETRPECECVGPLGDSINEAIEKWNERQ